MTAYKLIAEHKTIENVLEHVNSLNEDPNKKKKFIIPEKFLYKESRELFENADVNRDKEDLNKSIVFDKPDEEGLKEWLIGSKSFTEIKVTNGIERLKKCQGKKNQTRLDCFFKSGAISSS